MFSFARSIRLPLFLAAVSFAGPAAASDWTIDADHSHIAFAVRHLAVSNVRGAFTKSTGTVTLDDADITKSKIHLDIDVASVDSGNAKRDEHLKSPDFFDAAKFPKMTFDATKIEKVGADGLKVTGNLTLHGVTKPVVLSVAGVTGEGKDPWGGVHRGASATAAISRKDFGLTWNKALEAGGVVVGDEVKIELEIELAKKK